MLNEYIDKYEIIILFSDKINIEISEIDFPENTKIFTPKTSGYDIILDLYRTYDFSDKIIYLSDDGYCGGIINLVQNGIISVNELIRALSC